MASSEDPPLHPAELEHPLALLQQLTSCCGLREREDTVVPLPPWMRYIDSMAAVAANAQQDPAGKEAGQSKVQMMSDTAWPILS